MSTAAESRRRLPLPAPTDGPSSTVSSSVAGPTSKHPSYHHSSHQPSPHRPSRTSAASSARFVRPDDTATDLSLRSDRTSYSVPSDGSPITIPVPHGTSAAAAAAAAATSSATSPPAPESRHSRHRSRTNLLIEYFEGGPCPDGQKRRPSVRVRLTPASRRSSGSQTRSGPAGTVGGAPASSPPQNRSDGPRASRTTAPETRKPSYTRRMILPAVSTAHKRSPLAGTEVDSEDGSVNIEILSGGESEKEDDEKARSSVDLPPITPSALMAGSEISTMPPDSLLLAAEKSTIIGSNHGGLRSPTATNLAAPPAPYLNLENAKSHERLTQKVIERLRNERKQAAASGARSPVHPPTLAKKIRYDEDEYDEVDVYNARRDEDSDRSEADDDHHSLADDGYEEDVDERRIRRGLSQRRSSSPLSGVSLRSSPQVLDQVHQAIADVLLPEIRSVRASSQRQSNSQHSSSPRVDRDSQTPHAAENIARSSSTSSKLVPLTHHALETLNSRSSLQDEVQAQRERRKRRATTKSSSRLPQYEGEVPVNNFPLQSVVQTEVTRDSICTAPESSELVDVPSPLKTPKTTSSRDRDHTNGPLVPSPLARPASRQTPVKSERLQRLGTYHGNEEITTSATASPNQSEPSRSPLITPSHHVPKNAHGIHIDRHDPNLHSPSPLGSARARAAIYENLSAQSSPGKGLNAETERFFRQAHEENERYRHSDDHAPLKEEQRWSPVKQPNALQKVNANNPNYVKSPAVESASASLIEPSNLTASNWSSQAGSEPLDRSRNAEATGLSPIPEHVWKTPAYSGGLGLTSTSYSFPHAQPPQVHSRPQSQSVYGAGVKPPVTRPESPLFPVPTKEPTNVSAAEAFTPVPTPGRTKGIASSENGASSRPISTGYDLGASAIPARTDGAFPEMGYGTHDSISDIHAAGPIYDSAEKDEGYAEGDRHSASSPAANGRAKFMSGLSHGLDSPVYDSATGQGMERIKSKDIVALMDHLTVRDAQRNARDTEILVTLVRSAAEMRNQFEEIKEFIREQDIKLMKSTDASVQQVLRGPRPQPPSFSPRSRFSKPVVEQPEDQTKKPNVLRRALKGLSMSRAHDMAKMEDMLLQLLEDVEQLKCGQGMLLDGRPGPESTRRAYSSGLTSYDMALPREDPLKAAAESAIEKYDRHEADERSGPVSSSGRQRPSPLESHPANFFVSPPRNRSTLPEDADMSVSSRSSQHTIRPNSNAAYNQEVQTPPPGDAKRGSMAYSVPRVSRWSKTTASTANPEGSPRSDPQVAARPVSAASGTGDSRAMAGRPGSTHHQQRPSSPLIPETASAASQSSVEDPKFRAHRISLTLEHPKPRPVPTDVHRKHLESAAHEFEPVSVGVPGSEVSWASHSSVARDISAAQLGSIPSLARNMAPKFAPSGSQNSPGRQQRQPAPSQVQQHQPQQQQQQQQQSQSKVSPQSSPYSRNAPAQAQQPSRPAFAGGWYAYDAARNGGHGGDDEDDEDEDEDEDMYPNDGYEEDRFSGQILNLSNLPPAVNTLESHMPRPPLEAIEEIQSVRHSVDENASSLLSTLHRNGYQPGSLRRPHSVSSEASSTSTATFSVNPGSGDVPQRRMTGPRGMPPARRKDRDSSGRATGSGENAPSHGHNRGYSTAATPTPSEIASADVGYYGTMSSIAGSRNTPSVTDGSYHANNTIGRYDSPSENRYSYGGSAYRTESVTDSHYGGQSQHHTEGGAGGSGYENRSAYSGASERSAPRWMRGVTEEEWNDLSSYKSTPAPSETF